MGFLLFFNRLWSVLAEYGLFLVSFGVVGLRGVEYRAAARDSRGFGGFWYFFRGFSHFPVVLGIAPPPAPPLDARPSMLARRSCTAV